MKFLVLCLSLYLSATQVVMAHASITDAKVRDFIPGASNSVAYFTFSNESNLTRKIIAAQIDGIKRVELHQHEMIDGMMKMSKIESLNVAPFSQVHFRPGGLHLMLFEPTRYPKAGDKINLKLIFADRESLSVQADVFKLGAHSSNHNHH
jgi:copper(I)-binding protein